MPPLLTNSDIRVSAINYQERRTKALNLIGEGALLLTSFPVSQRYASIGEPYRQDSFLHYLTGFEEQDCALLLVGQKGGGGKSVLFLRDKDPVGELWEGRRLGVAKAKETFKMEDAFPISELWDKLPALLVENDRIFYRFGRNEDEDRRFINAMQVHRKTRGRTITSSLPVFDTDEVSGKMRLFKGPEEIERMRGAAAVTRKTFEKVYKTVRPGMSERDVHGLILQEFLQGGAEMQAYGAIVAGGVNACILHYKENSMPLNDGELLLIDAGSQFQYYASDVTRTFPVGKKFSAEQRAVYDIVLEAQLKAIDKAKPGATLANLHDISIEVITDGLFHIGILKGSKAEAVEKKSFFKYFPHKTSHWIGMDVHDVGDYFVNGKPRAFEPGMYFSVEPGIYIDPSDDTVPAGFRGVGIRIEDDVLITTNGNDVITGGIAKKPSELENRT